VKNVTNNLPTNDGSSSNDEVERVVAALAETAKERDVEGGTPVRERNRLRESGLLALTIDRKLGGHGESWGDLLHVVQRFARVDPSIAHVFAFHHLMVETMRLFGSPAQWTRAFEETVRERLFWGNALNPKDTRATLARSARGFVLRGTKSFCSGARDSDRLVVSAIDEETRALLVFVIPTRRAGVETLADWNAFGQRQTDSGTVNFSDVEVDEAEILRSPGPLATPQSSLRPCLSQAILAHVYLGIAEGAFDEARAIQTAQGGSRSSDPYVLLRAGELSIALDAARMFAERARAAIDRSLARGADVDERERGLVALDVARAKVSATQAGLAIAQGMFDFVGPRATHRLLGLDRYWRNLRVHTLHDPVDQKLSELGAFALNDRVPAPSFYS
jgi:alkylation response protein AidB-like acyl-CoA dehydrogenase